MSCNNSEAFVSLATLLLDTKKLECCVDRLMFSRVVKKLMQPPDNSIAEVRLTVLDCELSGHDTDSSV